MTSDINTLVELMVRLLIAGCFGGIIGFDREYREKEAGLRTHFLSQHSFGNGPNL